MLKLLFYSVLLMGNSLMALESLKLAPGRYVTVENNVQNSSEKVLVMLPGVYRAFDSRDVVIQLAKKKKLNFISINYSLQPESLRLVKSNETPYYVSHQYTREDLAEEVRAVLRKYNLEKPVIVGNSYSASVTTQLLKNDRFELVVETAPMMRFDETNPETVAILNFWKNWLRMNPFAGEVMARQYLLNSFAVYWSPRVDDLLKTYPQYRTPGLKDRLIAGYSHMSLVAEGFDFADQELTAQRRFFIFGEHEEKPRFKLQTAMAKKYEDLTGDSHSAVVIKSAGHIVPNDQPEIYLNILTKLLTKKAGQ